MQKFFGLAASLLVLALSMFGHGASAAAQDDLALLYTKHADCGGFQCGLEIKLAPDALWQPLAGTITNFGYEPEYEYQVLVREIAANQYQLVQVVAKTAIVDPNNPPATDIYTNTDEWVILYVHPALKDCYGLQPTTCLQIRTDPAAEWQTHFGAIVDFAFEPGYEYQLLVRKAALTAQNVADAPSFIYKLDHILQKTWAG